MYTYMITYRHTLSSQVHVFSSFCFQVLLLSWHSPNNTRPVTSLPREKWRWRSYQLRQSVSASDLKDIDTSTKNTMALLWAITPCTVAQKAATMTQTFFTSIGASKRVLGTLSAWQIPRRLPRTFREAQMPSVQKRAWTYVSQGFIAGNATTTRVASGGPRHPSTPRRCETF